MITVRESAQQIDAAAADWAARVDRGLTPDEDRALEAWLAGDVRRIGAYGRMRALALHTERAAALGSGYDPARFGAPTLASSRRGVLFAGGAVAASLVAATGLGLFLDEQQRQLHATRRGEVKVVPLADGSVVTLSTQSRIAVIFGKDQRRVELLEGEALFDVAKDAGRAFLVQAGETTARAIGTSFSVKRLPNAAVQVLVREGVVDVLQRSGKQSAAPVRLAANTRAVALARAASVETAAVPAADVSRELAWREGRIAFEGESLAAAISEFSRWSDTRIVITDPALAAEPVTGLFQGNDPVGFAQAVAMAFEARAQVAEGQVTLSR